MSSTNQKYGRREEGKEWELIFRKLPSFWTLPVEFTKMLLRVPAESSAALFKDKRMSLFTLFTQNSLFKQVIWG
jgi:hypothetical protein